MMVIEYTRTVVSPKHLAGRPPDKREIDRAFGLQLIAEGYAVMIEDDPPPPPPEDDVLREV